MVFLVENLPYQVDLSDQEERLAKKGVAAGFEALHRWVISYHIVYKVLQIKAAVKTLLKEPPAYSQGESSDAFKQSAWVTIRK